MILANCLQWLLACSKSEGLAKTSQANWELLNNRGQVAKHNIARIAEAGSLGP